ncbi:MAG: GAF domain-containing protein [Halieaceae bacterium]|jgi:light-regulated signal transduction histidine kinase (bacteriophytochrome)|nr:GAF domain-containing protein [Halieaceae bacterium]
MTRIEAHADLDACEREPLAFSGRIQDVGALFIASPGDFRISHHSNNLARWFDEPSAPSPTLQDYFQDDCSYFVHRRRPLFEGRHFLVRGALTNRGVEGDLLIATAEDEQLIVEFEAREAEPGGAPGEAEATITRNEHALAENILVEEALRRIHALTGYPKLMLYRFLDDGSGEVVGEFSDRQLDSYQGLRFPASDIPQVARRLYIDNPFRLIFDTRGAETEVVAVGAAENTPDLSLSTLRSVSPVHVEYLGNMGVRSSASFPIRVMGKLWGLLAMHAVDPTPLSMEARVAVTHLVEQDFARRLLDARVRADHERFNASQQLLEDCAQAVVSAATAPQQAGKELALLGKLIAADELCVRLDGNCLHRGDSLADEELEVLAGLAATRAVNGQFSTNVVSKYLDQSDHFRHRASGLLYSTFVSRVGSGRMEILWIRAEKGEAVIWAGNPEKRRSVVDGEERISPRQSFAAWHATNEGVAEAWLSSDLMLASKLLVRALALEHGD